MSKEYIIHTEAEICGIRKAAAAAALVRDQLASMVMAGMSTKNIDDLASTLISSTGGRSAFLGYRGYPGQICISLNDEVVHGIGTPDRVVHEGDVLSLDVGVNLDGYIGDNAISIVVGGNTDDYPDVKRLIEGTQESLMAGLDAARSGNFVRDIGVAVQAVATRYGLSVVREYVGHGCGVQLHEPPEIPNFVMRQKGAELQPGMVLAIEPMLNLGTHKVITDPDGWTVRTNDGKLSAHFEHMVLITETEPEILTWRKK